MQSQEIKYIIQTSKQGDNHTIYLSHLNIYIYRISYKFTTDRT
jgi:hypothetical protein